MNILKQMRRQNNSLQKKSQDLTYARTIKNQHSTSIKYKNGNENFYAYTLNDTGVAFGRIILALIEHHQDGKGNIIIPEALREFFGKDKIEKNQYHRLICFFQIKISTK